MTVKKSIPCSLYDIQGLQDWLDEMALQGLFFDSFSTRNDYANFQTDAPRPVRFRLDPVGRNKKEDARRKEPYAQMGWQFVDTLPRMYYIFSCEDPNAPELHSDPATLAYALNITIQKQIKSLVLMGLVITLTVAALAAASWKYLLPDLILVGNPQFLFKSGLSIAIISICLIIDALQIRHLLKTRRALELGLPLQAGRRWPRPRWFVSYLLFIFLPLFILPNLLVPSSNRQVYSLGETDLSYQWPSPAQLEGAGPRPLEITPHTDGYVSKNRSWFAPIQELSSINYWVRFPSDPAPSPSNRWLSVQYDQARSLKAASLVFQVELEDTARTLRNWAKWSDHTYHITGPTDLVPQDWPGLDRLAVAQYTQQGQDAWTFAALRGSDILVVHYTGSTPWENCLPLFLKALDEHP